MSFHSQLEKKNDNMEEKFDNWMELYVLKDADRLDELGAIGLARCFCYNGKINKSIYDPTLIPLSDLTFSEYTDKNRKSSAINHLYEKILTLKNSMNTETGNKIATQRHKFVEKFIKQFLKEINELE